jgi:hypothetical protein
VGDIESMPFVEALRQFQYRVGGRVGGWGCATLSIISAWSCIGGHCSQQGTGHRMQHNLNRATGWTTVRTGAAIYHPAIMGANEFMWHLHVVSVSTPVIDPGFYRVCHG